MSRAAVMMAAAISLSTAAAMLVPTADAAAKEKEKVAYAYGPEPSWDIYRKIAETAVIDKLIDPDSARIRWLGGFRRDEYKPFLAARVAGYVACGEVNGRNRMGGYTGARSFVVVIDYERVRYLEIANRANDMITDQCHGALDRGLFPKLPEGQAGSFLSPAAAGGSAAGSATSPSTTTMTGLTLRAMPEGAYVSAVADGSTAATAGVKPGMVIASINGIALAGMGDAMLKVASASTGTTTLTIVGGQTLTLAPKP